MQPGLALLIDGIRDAYFSCYLIKKVIEAQPGEGGKIPRSSFNDSVAKNQEKGKQGELYPQIATNNHSLNTRINCQLEGYKGWIYS